MPLGETIVSLSTPQGESAIAVIRLSGPACRGLADACFSESKKLEPRKAHFRRYHSQKGKLIDQVIAIYFEAGHSYTGEAMLELSCHGNPWVIQQLIEDLIDRGCRLAEPGEYTRTAFLNGQLDLAQAEAVADFITARGEQAIEMARRQLEGALGKRIQTYVETLLSIQARLEAYVDFPEEDLPEAHEAGPIQELAKLAQEFNQLLETVHYKESLSQGIHTVIAGAPNAGKSSLLNQLLGQERAIVSSESGTTRDYITEAIKVGPYCLKITDTAGIAVPQNEVEVLGMGKTMQCLAQADLILFVIDSAKAAPTLPSEMQSLIGTEQALLVENKIDLPDSLDHSDFMPELQHVRISAVSGKGVEPLRKQVVAWLEQHEKVPRADSLVINARHASAIKMACIALDAARTCLLEQGAAELAGSELRLAIDALEQIVGEIDNEAMLDQLFATFCIGK